MRGFPSLRGYRRSWVGPDLIAGLTLLAIAIPEQLATSRLAGMPPVTGFYAFVAGTACFALIGSNPIVSVGADSTIAPLFAIGIGGLATSGSAGYVDLVAMAAVVTGAIVVLIGLLRLGWLADLLSIPIITGFLAGVAVVIVIHQLPDLLGVEAAGGSNLGRIGFTLDHLGRTCGWSVGIGLGVLAVVIASEKIDRRVPGALIALIGSGVAVTVGGLQHHGVAILGSFAHGLPRLGLAGLSWQALRHVAPVAGVVALVVVSQTAATTRAFPGPADRSDDANRDFVAAGAGSVAAGLLGAFPVNASPPRTAAVAGAGGKSQAAGLGAAAAILLVLPAAGLLDKVPLAALAAVLVFVAGRMFRIRDLTAIGRFDAIELGLALVTLLTVALVGVEQGIGVAVGLAILDRTRLSARPQLHVLGRIPGTTSWTPGGSSEEVSQVPGVLVVLFATPLWYANAARFRTELNAALAEAPGTVELLVLDAVGMGDLDFTGIRTLDEILGDLEDQHVAFAIARAGRHVRESLSRSGLLARIGEDHLYPAVDEAVRGR